jgi:SEFIR domain
VDENAERTKIFRSPRVGGLCYPSEPVVTVFLSYRHEAAPHPARVLDLGERLRKEGVVHGIEVILDQLADAEKFCCGGPPEGWPQWSKDQAKNANKVLIVASAGWFRAFERTEVPGAGLGCAAEAGVLEQRLYNASGMNSEIRIVILNPGDDANVPLDLQRYHRFDGTTDFSRLLAWLSGKPELAGYRSTVRGFPTLPPVLTWPFCDCDSVRDAFARLLTAGTTERILPLQGNGA